MASSVNPLSALSGLTTPTSSVASPLATPSKDLFLQLLVAQIKNQDPLNPTDSTQFVSQLSQFSELEQVMAIRTGVDSMAAVATAAKTTTPTTPAP